jgi:1-deoxy-D-xylulose-5-phosphate synthase
VENHDEQYPKYAIPMKIIDKINSVSDLKNLEESQLPQLCEELRNFIIVETAENPGHLGASLGTVELTVAIHYVFDTPNDKLVWDVGHQAYPHKILTGRKDRFKTNRKFGGISGFPKMEESEYDAFGTGHSSTSISAILGMAMAAQLEGNSTRNHIAVIGDGSIGGGMAFEAMNQAGTTEANMLIILNDNKIAIDHNVGSISNHLLTITSSASYNRFKNKLYHFLTAKNKRSNRFIHFLSALGNVMKGLIVRESNMFQSMGFRYFGPANGHNVLLLVKILRSLKNIKGPKLLHIITKKGKGLSLAEQDQITYHAPGRFNPDTGEIILEDDVFSPPKYQEVFGETILELAEKDSKVVGITPAMATGCSMTIMKDRFPERVFDVGIAEQHALTFSAGLAIEGYIPFCNIYSSFLQRGYDQIIHDIALQKLPVIICIDRGGLVGEDGATHHGIFDLAFLRVIPNIIISSPMNEIELRNLLYTAYLNKSCPFVVRYPRGKGIFYEWKKPFQELETGKAEILREGDKVTVLSLGPLGNHAKDAIENLEKEGIGVGHVNMRFLKPLDEELLHRICQNYQTVITIEDGTVKGGLFSAVSEFMQRNNYTKKLIPIAIEDEFIEHGDIPNLYKQVGFDRKSIEDVIRKASHLHK